MNGTLIADRLEIADLFTRFGRLLDERRWDDAHTVFTPGVAALSTRAGDLHGLDELIAFIRGAEVEGEHTLHVTTDLLADVEGDHATASAYSLVSFYRQGQAPHRASGLRLTSTLERTAQGWRISEHRVTPAWTQQHQSTIKSPVD